MWWKCYRKRDKGLIIERIFRASVLSKGMNWQKSQEWNDCWRVLSACALACLELVEHRFRRHNSRHLPALCFTLWNINRFTEFTELRNQEGAGRFSFRLLLIWMRFLHELWRQKEHCGNGFWVINQQFSNWETKSDLKYCPVRFSAAHQFSFRINVESCVALPRQTFSLVEKHGQNELFVTGAVSVN